MADWLKPVETIVTLGTGAGLFKGTEKLLGRWMDRREQVANGVQQRKTDAEEQLVKLLRERVSTLEGEVTHLRGCLDMANTALTEALRNHARCEADLIHLRKDMGEQSDRIAALESLLRPALDRRKETQSVDPAG